MSQPILLWQQIPNPVLKAQLMAEFALTAVSTIDAILQQITQSPCGALVVDLTGSDPAQLDFRPDFVKENSPLADIPLMILSPSSDLAPKLRAFQMGCDDYLDAGTPVAEMIARIRKLMFHKIASEQLKQRLEQASAMAFTVMSDNSDLGATIQFLLETSHCDNLDQLGQLFFRVIQRYGLAASLQLRSAFGVKDMEASGLCRELEAQLLLQLQDAGRYVDFGRRTIMNYGRCSLLVRNMPVDDPNRYGAIKDNTFYLLQGLDARLRTLDLQEKLQREKATLRKMSQAVKAVMADIDSSYQAVMRDIVANVEDMAGTIQGHIPALALSVEQEVFFEEVTDRCVANTNRIFNDGLRVDETFTRLAAAMDSALARIDETPERQAAPVTASGSADPGADGVELF